MVLILWILISTMALINLELWDCALGMVDGIVVCFIILVSGPVLVGSTIIMTILNLFLPEDWSE